jgi:hypothetical protein
MRAGLKKGRAEGNQIEAASTGARRTEGAAAGAEAATSVSCGGAGVCPAALVLFSLAADRLLSGHQHQARCITVW